MKVRFYGFTLEAGDGISLPDFFQHLLTKSSATDEYDFNGRERLFLLDETQDERFYTGLFVTIKDHKKFCELRDEHGVLTIHVSEVDENADLMEFNFFIINKTTFCGLYQHYHASCSIGQHFYFLRTLWKELKETKINAHVQAEQAAGSAEPQEKLEKAAKKIYKKNLTYSLYYKPADFVALIAELASVRSFEYGLSTVHVPGDSFGPQNSNLKKVTEKVLFKKGTTAQQIAEQIQDFVNAQDISAGKVVGEDEEGIDRPVHLTNNTESFAEYEFDDVAAELELTLDNFSESWVISKLIEAAEQHPGMFVNDLDE